jgi:hypothetical protein
MRFIFLSIFLIFFISVFTFIAINTITGNITNTPNCPGGHTYAFYRTPQERQEVEIMYLKAGFIPVSYEVAPERFHTSGDIYLLCMRRMTNQELEQYHMRERERIVRQI